MVRPSQRLCSAKGFMPEIVPVKPDLRLEAALIEKLNRGEGDLVKITVELALLYSRTGRPRAAIPHLERLADALPDSETRSDLRLKCGQLMEQDRDFDSAKVHYELGLADAAISIGTRYLLHNNLGFCLNELGCHKEAKAHCRKAIRISRDQHNAYKNLAIALENLNDWESAAYNFAVAARRAPSDRRALMHLNVLLEAHPELYETVDDLRPWHEELLSRDEKLLGRLH